MLSRKEKFDYNSIIWSVETAMDIPASKLGTKACNLFWEMFYNSPHTRRNDSEMFSSRLRLARRLTDTLHRAEIERHIDSSVTAAKVVLGEINLLRESLDDLEAGCEKCIRAKDSDASDESHH